MLLCRVLGPLEIVVGAARVDPGGPQPRRLVAALAAARGAVVSEDSLAEAVWGDRPPASTPGSLQAYVSRLRRVLGKDALVRRSGGYALLARTDAEDFEGRVGRGRTDQQAGRPSDALRSFEAALRLWRGRPYPEIDELAEAERGRLGELHAVAVEERSAALLEVGDAPAAVAELLSSVRAEPYRERRWELLILALYRSGRQAEALSALRDVRNRLADDLGVDPGPALQSLERRLLSQDPGLLLRVRSPAPARPLSLFVGRGRELALLETALGAARLVTLVGPGGAGKTRLAVEWLTARAGSVHFVRLADVASAADLAGAVASALGLPDSAGFTGLDGTLLLDNCEHLTTAVASLVVSLLGDNPALRVVATSREELGVDGERLLPVDPLPIADAVTLLADRIAAVRPGAPPDPAELERLAVALDGIPLALELAAARARVLGLAELLAGPALPGAGLSVLGPGPGSGLSVLGAVPGGGLSVLGPVPRGGLAVHATMEATVAWSADLLPAPERALFLRLWPFEGGFTLEAAAAVGADLSSLSALVSRSVVAADPTVSPARYRLLEIIRAYSRDHDPDPAASRAAQAAWARDLVARTMPDFTTARSARAVRVLERDLPNLRAALAHDLSVEPEAALRTAAALEWFWIRGGHVTEGLRVLTAALAGAPHAPAADRARALSASAGLHWIGGDLARVEALLPQALALVGTPRDDRERRMLGQLRYYEALLAAAHEDYEGAARCARTSIASSDASWFGPLPRVALGGALAGLGDRDAARTVLTDALAEARTQGFGWCAGLAGSMLARTWLTDDPVRALPPLHDAAGRFREEGDAAEVLACLMFAALALFRSGSPKPAATLLSGARHHASRRGIRLENADPSTAAAAAAAFAALDAPTRALAETDALSLSEDDLVDLLAHHSHG